jgi:hypothetical protein
VNLCTYESESTSIVTVLLNNGNALVKGDCVPVKLNGNFQLGDKAWVSSLGCSPSTIPEHKNKFCERTIKVPTIF